MDIAALTLDAIRASAMLLVFALGLRSMPGDVAWLIGKPSLLARSMIAMNVVMPVLVATSLALTSVPAPVKVGLLVLALSPVPPFLPGRQLRLGPHAGYVYALFIVSAVATLLVTLPTLLFLAVSTSESLAMHAQRLLFVVGTTMVVPLLIGIYVRQLLPQAAAFIARHAERAGTLLLWMGLIAIAILQAPAMLSLVGNGTLAAVTIFSVIGLVVGHALGGPEPEQRSVLAAATACRHPGVALAISSALFPDQALVPAAVLLALLASAAVSATYMSWRMRAQLVR